MGVARLHQALERLTAAIRDVETELDAMRTEQDSLASHIFISRRHYRNASHQRRKAPRDERSVDFQHRLRAGLSRESGRMGALDGCGDEAATLTRTAADYAAWEIHPVMQLPLIK